MYTTKDANTYIDQTKNTVKPTHRHHFHLMGACGWINDPNGFSHFRGRYHLFFQHYPYKSEWGPMHWGHASSEDMIRWEHHPVALAPDKPYDKSGCFSGSALAIEDTLYLMYTGHKEDTSIEQVQCIAKSKDGIAFEKHTDNPVIDQSMLPEHAEKEDFRDPKILRRNGVYYSLIGSRNTDGSGQLLLYESKNLIDWTYHSAPFKSNNTLGSMWECPDMVTLSGKDIVLFSPQFMDRKKHRFTNVHASVYAPGKMDFAQGRFTPDYIEELDKGFDFYAPQTMTSPDGRTLLVAWMQMWDDPIPSAKDGWAGAMTLPRELTYENDHLYQTPIEELKNYRTDYTGFTDKELEDKTTFEGVKGDTFDLELALTFKEAKRFTMKLRKNADHETALHYDVATQRFRFDRDRSGSGPGGQKEFPLPLENGRLKLRIVSDKSSIEIFFQGGRYVLTSTLYPSEDATAIEFNSVGPTTIERLNYYNISV